MTESLTRLALLLTVFAAVILLVLGVSSLVSARQAVRRRIPGVSPTVDVTVVGNLRGSNTSGSWQRLLQFIEERGLSLSDSNESQIARRLAAAGFTHPAATRAYTLIRLVLAISLPALILAALFVTGRYPGLFTTYLIASAAGLFGLYLPNLFVSAKADRRRQALVNGFPDALDLLLVCVEAGLSLDLAFDRVGREMVAAHPLVAELFADVVTQLRAGRSREETLERMGEKAGVDEIRSFATLLVQSSQLGVSVALSLRTYANEMRERRRMNAEERAYRIPVLLSMPLVGCLLPVMIGVLMLPAVIRVIRTLLPALAGQ